MLKNNQIKHEIQKFQSINSEFRNLADCLVILILYQIETNSKTGVFHFLCTYFLNTHKFELYSTLL